MDNTFRCSFNRNLLREVTVKIELKGIDMQKEITVETLLDSGVGMFNKEELIENTVEINIL